MAMAVTYTTFDGEIIHENRGGVQRDYIADTLGSTQALLDSTGAVTDTFDYWPYGEIRSRTGTTETPFTFVGTLGYFADSPKRFYIRARHYLNQQARWLTVDPLWPEESAYGYGVLAPIRMADPFGMSPCAGDPCIPNRPPTTTDGCIALMCNIKASNDTLSRLKDLPECLKDIVKRIQKEIKGRNDNFNPSDCCKAAHGGDSPTDKDKAIIYLIGLICRQASTACKSVGHCAKNFPEDTEACKKCCALSFVEGKAAYYRCVALCP